MTDSLSSMDFIKKGRKTVLVQEKFIKKLDQFPNKNDSDLNSIKTNGFANNIKKL